MARPSNTDVMKREDAANALTIPADDMLAMFAADAGAGTQFAADDIKIPRIVLLQSLSPEVTDGHAKYVDGARPGMFFNTVTKELYGKDGVVVVPIHYTKAWGEWIPRDAGGGLVTVHVDKATALREQRKDIVTELVETANHYVLVKTAAGTWAPALLNFTKTKLSVSREWNTLVMSTSVTRLDGSKVTPPAFARLYRMTSALTTNTKGNFYKPAIAPMGWVDRATYDEAKSFHELVRSGELAARKEDLAGGAHDDAHEYGGEYQRDDSEPSF